MILVSKTLSLEPSQIIHTLKTTSSGTPAVLQILVDEHGMQFSCPELLTILLDNESSGNSNGSTIGAIDGALDSGLFDLKDSETLVAVR